MPQVVQKDLANRQLEVERLREQLLRQEQFLDVAAHELRNPMQSLAMQLASAQALASGAGADDIAGRLAQVQATLTRYLDRALVLLDLARLDSGRYPVERSPINLTQVIGHLLDRLRQEADFHGVQLVLHAVPSCLVHSDPLLIEQIVGNLVGNAFKHSSGTRVDVRLTLEADGTAIIEIDDDGVGITPRESPHLFAELGQQPTDKPAAGFGLGLWIVRELTTALGGSVSLEGKMAAGSLFRLILPPIRP